MKMTNETMKIMGDRSIKVSATCVRVPVLRAHSESVWIETEKELTPQKAREPLSTAKGVEVIDNPAENKYPMPLFAQNQQKTFVGRIRKDISCDNGLTFWVVSDNLLKGAALNAVEIAEKVDNDVVFMSAGFETTAPATASELLNKPPENFSIISCHRLIPPAIDFLINSGETNLNALIEPGHVCTILGTEPFEKFSTEYGIPQAVAGFNPLDILMSVYMILRQIDNGTPRIDNEYKRAVRTEGNVIGKEMMDEVFHVESREWRGFPKIPNSVLDVNEEFAEWDARKKYDIEVKDVTEAPKGCICGPILRGMAKPTDCKLFRKACNPMHPIGACMVSKEGTCNIAHRYSR
jgi:hydrogenase expression/formation protein HypD